MRYCKVNWALRALAIIFTVSSLSALAADYSRSSIIPQKSSPAVSNRLIVKYKPARQTSVLSAAQVATELRRPLSAETLNQLQAAAGISLTESHAISNGAHVLILQGSPDKQTIDQAISNIRGLSDVEYVEEDRVLTTQSVPNDASYGNLWGLKPVSAVASPATGGTGSYGADFETAWNINTGISSATALGVVIAVVDTGITSHADIVGSGGTVSPTSAGSNLISPGYTFISDCRMRGTTATSGCAANFSGNTTVAPTPDASDTGDFISVQDMSDNPALFPPSPPAPAAPVQQDSTWHGTHVSGTIVALGNNGIGVIGGAYSARILPVRVLGKGGGYVSDIAEGVLWAAGVHPTITNPNPAKVINLSLGGTGACSATEQNAINAAVAAGAVIVVAAGNDNADVANHSPANCSNVITVAATGRDGSRALYSNFSSPASNTTNPVHVTLAAQGGLGDAQLLGFDPGIYSTINSGTTTPLANCTTSPTTTCYTYHQGTSMATPHVAAAIALMLARNPALTPAQLKSILSASVTAFPSFPSSGYWTLYDCATLKNCGTGILNAQFAVQNSVLPYSTATAFAATRSSGGGSGGCSIMPAGGNPDISLLFSMLALLAYSFRQRISLSLGQN
jgi:serine protease